MASRPDTTDSPSTRSRYRLRRRAYASSTVGESPVGHAAHGMDSTPAIDPAAMAELETNAARLGDENATLRDAVARQRAEFDNYRRRTLKEKEQVRDAAREDFAVKLLEVVDNFDRALESSANITDAAPLREGVDMVARQFKRLLEGEGLRPIEALNLPFNPQEHDALAIEETSEFPENHVTHVMSAGYRFGDKVVRPAKVKVAKAPAVAQA